MFLFITFVFDVHFRISFKHLPSNIPDEISWLSFGSFWYLEMLDVTKYQGASKFLYTILLSTQQNIYIILDTHVWLYLPLPRNTNSKTCWVEHFSDSTISRNHETYIHWMFLSCEPRRRYKRFQLPWPKLIKFMASRIPRWSCNEWRWTQFCRFVSGEGLLGWGGFFPEGKRVGVFFAGWFDGHSCSCFVVFVVVVDF